jgi:hypothetical protein
MDTGENVRGHTGKDGSKSAFHSLVATNLKMLLLVPTLCTDTTNHSFHIIHGFFALRVMVRVILFLGKSVHCCFLDTRVDVDYIVAAATPWSSQPDYHLRALCYNEHIGYSVVTKAANLCMCRLLPEAAVAIGARKPNPSGHTSHRPKTDRRWSYNRH